jgi:pectin methylesterase-like acyl-CoA thioesterase
MVVAADGSGDYNSIQAAVDAVAENNKEQMVIFIKKGTYKEKVRIPKNKPFISFVGESKEETVITYTEITGTGFNINATVVEAKDFSAENLTFANGAGATGTAAALEMKADRASFKNVRFLGYQDTLYLHAKGARMYFKDCYIEGAVDFIYGDSVGYFENCEIHNVRSGGYITASSTPEGQTYGIVFVNCKVTGESGVTNVYLGRPWKPFAKVAFINTWMDEGVVHAAGWHNWNDPKKEETTTLMEYNSQGPSGDMTSRVTWAKKLSDEEASQFTPEQMLMGNDNWTPFQS